MTYDENDVPQYEYHLKDHLGNVRIAFADKDGDGYIEPFSVNPNAPNGGGDGAAWNLTDTEILQESHYYPFGMAMDGAWQDIVNGPENKYLYNGKELNSDFGLDWSDYGARYYDAAIGRFSTIDPHAENYYNLSSYHYVHNNPLIFIDPTGMDEIYVNEKGEYKGQDANKDDKTVRVISDSDWEASEKADDGSITPRSTANAISKSTALSEHEAGIAISDDAWTQVENVGGEKLTSTVQNNSSNEALVLPEKFDKKTVVLGSGEGYYPKADGVSTAASRAKGEVHKIGDNSKVEVTSSGKVNHVNWVPSRLVKSGTRGKSYLNSFSGVKPKWAKGEEVNYNHWARAYGVPSKSPNTLVPTGSN